MPGSPLTFVSAARASRELPKPSLTVRCVRLLDGAGLQHEGVRVRRRGPLYEFPPPAAEPRLLDAVRAAARVDVITRAEVAGREPSGHCLVADAGPAGGLWLRVLHAWLTTEEDLLEAVEARLRAAGLAVWSVPRGRREGELFVRAAPPKAVRS